MPRLARYLATAVLPLILVAGTAAAPPQPNTDRLGSKVEHLSLRDAGGRNIVPGDAKATVVIFLSFDCPVSTSYAETLTRLFGVYEPKGVAFVGACPTDEGPAEIAKHAKEYRLSFPIVKDEKNAAAIALKAATTPEAFVISATRFWSRSTTKPFM